MLDNAQRTLQVIYLCGFLQVSDFQCVTHCVTSYDVREHGLVTM